MHLANLDIPAALQSLGTAATGLTASEAARRLREYGENRILAIGAEPEWRRLLREFTHFFALILWVAAGLAFFAESRDPGAGMWQLGMAVVAVITNLEERLGFSIDDDEIDGATFATVGSLVDFVERKVAA